MHVQRRCVLQAKANPTSDMQPSLQTLVQRTFALGPFKQPKTGRAAVFTTRFGLVVLVLGILAGVALTLQLHGSYFTAAC